jgi:hypothetical protein
MTPTGIIFIWGELWGLATFRGPKTSSMKTSFHEKVFLQNATRHFSPTTVVGSVS